MKRHQTIKQRPKRDRGSRAGFTLLELLISVSVIALLIGLLFPAFSSMRRSARVAEVKSDIDSLADALEVFKAEFNEYPPSRVTLYPAGASWDARSQAIIRKLWPKFNFSNPDYPADFFASGETEKKLDGAECLVFFLGGVRRADGPGGTAGSFVGFSANDTQPFSLAPAESRKGPFFPFPFERLRDEDGDGLVGYLDPLPEQTKPYIYLSSYNGRGYNLDDLDADGDLTDTSDRRMTAIYTQTGSTGWNSERYQIISAGFDRKYGPGGPFDPDSASGDLSGTRIDEADNITNFHGGMLGK